ncbi:MAG TPA: isochorismatase family protein, partial [Acidimicrobiales bacterium]
MTRSLSAVGGAIPYPWPYHGPIAGEQLALVIGLDEQWMPPPGRRSEVSASLRRLEEAVHAVGGIVVVITKSEASGVPPTVARPVVDDLVVSDQVVEAPGLDGFFSTDLDQRLRAAGRTDLLIAGWGLEGPVHSTLRSANDRGYECLLVWDACSAIEPVLFANALDMIRHSGGIFGAFSDTSSVLAALESEAAPNPALEPVMPEPAATLVTIDSAPYPWPYDEQLVAARTALICIDWQVDFCGPGGYVDRMGYDLSLTRSGLGPTAEVLAAAREWGATVIHTREGHRPDLSDCPANKLWRSRRIGAGIGDPGPTG